PSKPVQRADQVGEGAVTNEPSPGPSLKGRGKDEWLIDPKEWYTPEERKTATGAKSDEGADAAPSEKPADAPPADSNTSSKSIVKTPSTTASPPDQSPQPEPLEG